MQKGPDASASGPFASLTSASDRGASGRGHRGASAGSSSFFSTTSASVVRSIAAIEAAFSSADRVTLTGSMTPAATRSTYSPVAAFRPWPAGSSATLETTT